MKTCSRCEKPLAAPIYEYGDARAPVCQSCFLDPTPKDLEVDVKQAIKSLEQEIEDIEDEIRDLETDKESMEDRIEDLRKGKTTNRGEEQQKLNAWSKGLAKEVHA